MKKLEDMNLVDDFLVYSLTAHKTYGEEASRYILECILQRRIRHLTVVPQKTWYGEQPENHGVRLDVYLDEEDGEIFDLEPDNNDKAGNNTTLPRRVRFYHSKIDAGNLTAGEDYSVLRNVVVIFITTYDPLGRNRMIYTVKNSCVEEPGIPYEDGASTIFLYTKGCAGKPPETLRQLAHYMEHSVSENARTAGLARLHELVTKVKTDRKVGLAYMKAIEIEKSIWEKAHEEGRAEESIKRREETIEDITELLGDYGTVSELLKEKISNQDDMHILRQWYKLAARVRSLEEFERLISAVAEEKE